MESKSDYFRSPHPRTFQNFISPTDQLNLYQQNQSIFENNLFTPYRRNTNSPFHFYQPNFQSVPKEPQHKDNESEAEEKIKSVINFEENQSESESDKLNEMCEQIEEFETPKKSISGSRNAEYNTTARKASQKKPDNSRDHTRGLRNLSKQAYDILQVSSPLTYQQVAEKMIQQKENNGEIQNDKEKQSIKRRVYDALNVLISVGLLSKQGKKIAFTAKRKEAKCADDSGLKVLIEKIRRKKSVIGQKMKQIRKYKTQKRSLGKLIKRNQEVGIPLGLEENIIKMPFIVAADINEQFLINKNTVVFGRLLSGDLDAVCHLDFCDKI